MTPLHFTCDSSGVAIVPDTRRRNTAYADGFNAGFYGDDYDIKPYSTVEEKTDYRRGYRTGQQAYKERQL